MSVIKDFVLSKGGETQARSQSTNTNTNNISINVSSDQGGIPMSPTPQPPIITPQPSGNFTTTTQQHGQTATTEDPVAVAYPSTLVFAAATAALSAAKAATISSRAAS